MNVTFQSNSTILVILKTNHEASHAKNRINGKFMKSEPGLPDGFFSNQKSQFGKILEGLRWENVNIFYGHLEYFTNFWDIL
jgi:hypothetical protein